MAFLERLLPAMRTRGWGRVVAVGSMSVREPIAALQLSNAHRPGLVAAFKILAKQSAADGVTLNTVLPGRIATDRIFGSHGSREAAEAAARADVPAGRLGTVEEFAAAAVFLCSDAAATSPAPRCWSTAGSPHPSEGLDSARVGPLAQLAEQGTSGRSASRETASSSAAICWNPLRALGTGSAR